MSHRIGSVSATLQCGAFSLTLKKKRALCKAVTDFLLFSWASSGFGVGKQHPGGRKLRLSPQLSAVVAAVVAAVCVFIWCEEEGGPQSQLCGK